MNLSVNVAAVLRSRYKLRYYFIIYFKTFVLSYCSLSLGEQGIQGYQGEYEYQGDHSV